MTMWPPAWTASSRISTTGAAGSSRTRISIPLSHHALRRHERRAVRGIAQQRLAHALAEDPALAARGAHHRPFARGPVALAPARLQPAGRAVQRHRLARGDV